jgi:hypothetical protein
MPAPPLPVSPRNRLRLAGALNVFLPGSGLFLLGWRKSGALLAGLFLFCFVAVLGIFVAGYARYLSIALDPHLLEGNKLEEAGAAFHQEWLITLAVAGAVIYLISTFLFMRARRGLEAS